MQEFGLVVLSDGSGLPSTEPGIRRANPEEESVILSPRTRDVVCMPNRKARRSFVEYEIGRITRAIDAGKAFNGSFAQLNAYRAELRTL